MYFSNLKWGEAESIGPNRCESDVPLVVPRLVVSRSANRYDVLDFHALTTILISILHLKFGLSLYRQF